MIRRKELNLALVLMDEFKILDTKLLVELVNALIASAELIYKHKIEKNLTKEELKIINDKVLHIITKCLKTEYYDEFYSSLPYAFSFKVSKKNSNYLNGECKYGIGL